ncbi:hypothetical protein IPP92_01160 [Candidatus Saccharibacteria bacterium]|nr:MAG: hypothetical protein IPP92_01160 [Candidatus Saccharibacteria bacterium]
MRTRAERLTTAIEGSWSLETTSTPDTWYDDVPTRGQCVPTSLVIQDYLGGDIERLRTLYAGASETHYRNRIDGNVLDLTRSQYPPEQSFEQAPVDGDTREYVFANPATRARYQLLTTRVQRLMYLQSMAEHPEDSAKPVALFDLDGVILDFDARVEAELKRHGIAIPPRSDFYMTKRLTDPEHIALVRDLQHSKGFFESLEPIPGAIEAWHFVRSLGFHARICSAPISGNPWSIREKLVTVERYLGPRAADEAYIGKRKSECSGVMLFDDRPTIADAANADWLHAHYTQDYNQHVETPLRVRDWTELDKVAEFLGCALKRSRSVHL